MNQAQELWWYQAQSDFRMFEKLQIEKCETCHILHFIQMATEKLAKAYLWRSGKAPPKVHVGFVKFLRALASRNDRDLTRIAHLFGFGRAEDFVGWVNHVLPLAYEIQKLAPAEANDGPNPEYPWPHDHPTNAPAGFTFSLWVDLSETERGKKILAFVKTAIEKFVLYG